MRLLFDHNLSPALKVLLADIWPQSLHVWDLDMDTADDTVIWAYAEEQGLVIVTKDADYRDLSLSRGHPPKVIWLRLGNGPTSQVAALLRSRHSDLLAFHQDNAVSLLELP